MFRRMAVLLAVAALLGACGDDGDDSADAVSTTTTEAEAADSTTTTEAPEPEMSDEVDPYDIYLQNAPAGEEVLSREDAQARAYLGCGENFAPGTVDRVLADAYRPMGICD